MRTVKPTRVDVYLESKECETYLIDIKTAKPNKGGFKEFKRTLLEWTATVLAENPNAKINTLLSWILVSKLLVSIAFQYKINVSILVIVDIGLKGTKIIPSSQVSICFNPCYRGYGSQRLQGSGDCGGAFTGFNPS